MIIGILAAIAIPAFLNHRGKAYDAAAKSQIKTAQLAEETYATENNRVYTAAIGNLTAIEPSLNSVPAVVPSAVTAAPAGYTLTSV